MLPHLPLISCNFDNHHQMPFQYVCLHQHCLINSQELACVYCCQQFHKHHFNSIKAIRQILIELYDSKLDTEFKAADILLKGISTCSNQLELRRNISELISYKDGGKKFEKLLDSEMKILNSKTKSFYEKKDDTLSERTIKKKYKGQCTQTQFISPVLTFLQPEIQQSLLTFKSPFCLSNPSQGLKTAFGYPSLNKYTQSVQTIVKIQRLTPYWLGVGLSRGRQKYQQGSKSHLLFTSNGWVSVFGKMQKTSVKYGMKDKLTIKWDKSKELFQMNCNREKHVMKIRPEWNQDVYLCIVLYYRDDGVRILS